MRYLYSEAATEQIMWSEGFATGIAEVDNQHRIVVSLLDTLRRVVVDQRHHDQKDRLSLVLDQFNECASKLFLAEEKLMREHLPNHPSTTGHIQSHLSYRRTVASYASQLRHGGNDLCEKLYDFLREWWMGHILTTDQEMGAALRALEAAA